ncbi:ADP-ribose pyrophosphatase YjhB, NUDIX family [Seinonella peptonophila]|uniref:ADP-ribose pyrophosphatase YjhB, NUDIX family n=1 Tax=Seinonella peptonophila TaxID=112248 RepID=A0A1M4ZQ10_9BACL|nr:NUDIX hydrolase [Seinonella peptonophila]SHF20094.1 ADP-ribose pyrophosphatase YjhB, NUDIX family [Seinonella peptonophila]
MDIVFQTDGKIFNHRVAGIFINHQHVLLQKGMNDSFWALPGGRIQLHEDSVCALKREFYEELGVSVQVGHLLWIVENFFELREQSYHELGLYYHVIGMEPDRFTIGDFYENEGKSILFRWIPIEELKQCELMPSFLKEQLGKLPGSTEHIVVRD